MNTTEMTIEARHLLGKRVRHFRRSLRLTQEQLGWIAGMHRTRISRIEHGQCSATFDTLVLIASALDVPLSTLLEGVDVP